MKVQEAIFYAENGMVLSTNPGGIQTALKMFMRLFDGVGLNTNAWKTVGMV